MDYSWYLIESVEETLLHVNFLQATEKNYFAPDDKIVL